MISTGTQAMMSRWVNCMEPTLTFDVVRLLFEQQARCTSASTRSGRHVSDGQVVIQMVELTLLSVGLEGAIVLVILCVDFDGSKLFQCWRPS
jgi:hypothetical protein